MHKNKCPIFKPKHPWFSCPFIFFRVCLFELYCQVAIQNEYENQTNYTEAPQPYYCFHILGYTIFVVGGEPHGH